MMRAIASLLRHSCCCVYRSKIVKACPINKLLDEALSEPGERELNILTRTI